MQRDRKLELIRRALSQQGRVKGDELVLFCPKHTARANRSAGQLSVNLSTDWFNCWSCGFSGRSLVQLFRPLGREVVREYLGTFSPQSFSRKRERVEVQLPSSFVPLCSTKRSLERSAAVGYVRERGFGMEHILMYRLGCCESGPYRSSVIIPSFDADGKLNFFAARSMVPTSQKYIGNRSSKDIIWNDHLIDWDRPITIVEGPFDAMRVGDNAVPLQGSILSEDSLLFEKIVLSGGEVCMALDDDAMDKQLRMIDRLLGYGVPVRHADVSKLGEHDIGGAPPRRAFDVLASARRVSSDLDIARIRLGA